MAAAAVETKEAPAAVLPVKHVLQTSIATRGTPPGEVSVQFRRYTTHGLTAYQKGQYAGFPLAVAERLESAGAVLIDPGYRREPATSRMVRK